jgi:hypothetical protein
VTRRYRSTICDSGLGLAAESRRPYCGCPAINLRTAITEAGVSDEVPLSCPDQCFSDDEVSAARRLLAALENTDIGQELAPCAQAGYGPNQWEMMQGLQDIVASVPPKPGEQPHPTKIAMEEQESIHTAATVQALIEERLREAMQSPVLVKRPQYKTLRVIEPRTQAVDISIINVAACRLAGGTPPEWLVAGLIKGAGWLAGRIEEREAYPKGHVAFIEKLEAIARDARMLDRPDIDEDMRVGLRDVIGRVEVRVKRIPRKRGRQRYYPGVESGPVQTRKQHQGSERRKNRSLVGLDPKEFCACLVEAAWQANLVAQGKALGSPGKGKAHDVAEMAIVCELMWEATGGDALRQWNIKNVGPRPMGADLIKYILGQFNTPKSDGSPRRHQDSIWRGHLGVAVAHLTDYVPQIRALCFPDPGVPWPAPNGDDYLRSSVGPGHIVNEAAALETVGEDVEEA